MNAFVEAKNDEAASAALLHVVGANDFELVRPRAFDALRDDIRNGRELGLLDE
jgi:hypothetical protein